VRSDLSALADRLQQIVDRESDRLKAKMGRIDAATAAVMAGRIETLKDIVWTLKSEILENARKIRALFPDPEMEPTPETLQVFKNINAVLNAIDRLEVRGRDSAGISLLFRLESDAYLSLLETL